MCDFDIEAMHLVEFDLEAGNAAALTFADFHVDQIGATVVIERTQFVELGVVTVGNRAAIADLGGRFGGNRADQQIKRRRWCVEIDVETVQ